VTVASSRTPLASGLLGELVRVGQYARRILHIDADERAGLGATLLVDTLDGPFVAVAQDGINLLVAIDLAAPGADQLGCGLVVGPHVERGGRDCQRQHHGDPHELATMIVLLK